MLTQASLSELDQLGRRVTAGGNDQRRRGFEQTIEQTGIAGHSQVQVLANLAGHGRRLLDEVAAMPCSQLQFPIGRFQLQLAQPEPGHGRSVLSVQIRFVGLVARIGRHPILLGGEGMDDTRFESGAGKRSLGRQVVVSRPLNDDDRVLNVVLLLGLANLLHGQLEANPSVLQTFGVR